jgi:hypothetical protein
MKEPVAHSKHRGRPPKNNKPKTVEHAVAEVVEPVIETVSEVLSVPV